MIILTKTEEEYNQMIKIADVARIHEGLVYRPEHSHARIVWSIDDIRDKLPENATDKELNDVLKHVENGIKSAMMAAGWDAINDLEEDMNSYLLEKRSSCD